MTKIITQASILASWYRIIAEAEEKIDMQLDEELESYTVFMLIRFTEKTEIGKSIIAIDFLNALSMHGTQHQQELQSIGDKCLLLSGLFPGIATKRRVDVSYFMGMGQNAYQQLNALTEHDETLYANLTENFGEITKVLGAIRPVAKEGNHRLWAEGRPSL